MKPQNIREEVQDRVRRIIERRKAFCTRKHWWQSVDPSSFPSLDVQFYDETRDRAIELGFVWLGDFELMRDPPAETIGRTFERVMVGDEGRIQLYFEHVRSEGRQRIVEVEADSVTNARHIQIATEFTDGSFLFTDNMRGRLPMPLLDKVPQFRSLI